MAAPASRLSARQLAVARPVRRLPLLASSVPARSFSSYPAHRMATPITERERFTHDMGDSGAPKPERTPDIRSPRDGSPTTLAHHVSGPPPDLTAIPINYDHGPTSLDKASKLFFLTEIARGGPACSFHRTTGRC